MTTKQHTGYLTDAQTYLAQTWAMLPIDHSYACESARWVLAAEDAADAKRLWRVFTSDLYNTEGVS